MQTPVTLPQLSIKQGESLDVIRSVIRANPELQKLGTKFGPIKVYSAEEVKKILAAVEAKRIRRGKRATAA